MSCPDSFKNCFLVCSVCQSARTDRRCPLGKVFEIATARGIADYFASTLKALTDANPFAVNVPFAAIWAACFVARVPVDGKHLALVALHGLFSLYDDCEFTVRFADCVNPQFRIVFGYHETILAYPVLESMVLSA